MSIDYYMCCDDCKLGLHVAQDGFSGFTFYYGEIPCMFELKEFLKNHKSHAISVKDEHHFHDSDYSEIEWNEKLQSSQSRQSDHQLHSDIEQTKQK